MRAVACRISTILTWLCMLFLCKVRSTWAAGQQHNVALAEDTCLQPAHDSPQRFWIEEFAFTGGETALLRAEIKVRRQHQHACAHHAPLNATHAWVLGCWDSAWVAIALASTPQEAWACQPALQHLVRQLGAQQGTQAGLCSAVGWFPGCSAVRRCAAGTLCCPGPCCHVFLGRLLDQPQGEHCSVS